MTYSALAAQVSAGSDISFRLTFSRAMRIGCVRLDFAHPPAGGAHGLARRKDVSAAGESDVVLESSPDGAH